MPKRKLTCISINDKYVEIKIIENSEINNNNKK